MHLASKTTSFSLRLARTETRTAPGALRSTTANGGRDGRLRVLLRAERLGETRRREVDLPASRMRALADWLDRVALGAETGPFSLEEHGLAFHTSGRTPHRVVLEVHVQAADEAGEWVLPFDLKRMSLGKLAEDVRKPLARVLEPAGEAEFTLGGTPAPAPAASSSGFFADGVEFTRLFFGQFSQPNWRHSPVRRLLLGAFWSMVIVPALFFLNYGEVTPLGWGMAVFLGMYCLLMAVGLTLTAHPQYQIRARASRDWLDTVGAFWLVVCAFGPFFSWLLVSFFSLTPASWRWLYGGWVFLSTVLPVLTGLPLLRYVRGKAAPIMLALLLGITSLPVLSALPAVLDLVHGPVASETQAEMRLLYTRRDLPAP